MNERTRKAAYRYVAELLERELLEVPQSAAAWSLRLELDAIRAAMLEAGAIPPLLDVADRPSDVLEPK